MCFARDQGYGKGGGRVDGGKCKSVNGIWQWKRRKWARTDGRAERKRDRDGGGGGGENRGRGDGGENRLFKLYDRRGQPAKQVLLLESEY